jgi:hypothetical protein
MPDIKHVCLIDAPKSLATAFTDLGCAVLEIRTAPARFLSLPESLASQGFTPDLVLQVESLGPRCLLAGLDQVDCPTVLWCVDPHLNGYWHACYARLFDLTCSTQRASIAELRGRGASDVRWLPTFGHAGPSPAHAGRPHDMAFVGRVTPQRPGRAWMVRLLRERCAGYDLAVCEGLTFGAMMDLYRQARIIPNETILGEVNFRLFEGASCGCLVLSQALGEEQEALFEPGREFDTYADAAELDAKLALYLKAPKLSQAMGQAAWERVRAEHLAVHRAQRLLAHGRDAARNRATGPEAALWEFLTVASLWEGGMLELPVADMLRRLAETRRVAGDSPELAVAALRLRVLAGKGEALSAQLDALLTGPLWPVSPEVNLTGAMAALSLDRFDAAKTFWYRHVQASAIRNPGIPETPSSLRTLWAKDLARRGRVSRAGFPFDPALHLPASATECLLRILHDEAEHLPTLRLLDSLFKTVPGMAQVRVGLLSVLTLHERSDWRLALELALADLASYRLESGLEELDLARTLAIAKEQGRAFDRALAAYDRSGVLAARLAT